MKSPAFQFYPGDWLGSQRVTLLSLAEEGAYARLLCHCWRSGSIPSDPKACAKLIGKGGATTVVRVVQAMFEPDPNDPSRLIHPRLEAEREKQADWSAKSSAGGKASAEARKNKKGRKGGSRVVEKCLEPNGNTSFTSSSSPSGVLEDKSSSTGTLESVRASTKARAATPDEVEAFAVTAGCLPGQGISFFWKMEGNGWTNGGKPVKDWKAVIRHWFAEGYMPAPTIIAAPESNEAARYDDRDADDIRAGMAAAREELRIAEEGSDEFESIPL